MIEHKARFILVSLSIVVLSSYISLPSELDRGKYNMLDFESKRSQKDIEGLWAGDKKNVFALKHLLYFEKLSGENDHAIDYVKKLIRLRPRNKEYWNELIKLYQWENDKEKEFLAKERMREILKINHEDNDFYFDWLKFFRWQKNYSLVDHSISKLNFDELSLEKKIYLCNYFISIEDDRRFLILSKEVLLEKPQMLLSNWDWKIIFEDNGKWDEIEKVATRLVDMNFDLSSLGLANTVIDQLLFESYLNLGKETRLFSFLSSFSSVISKDFEDWWRVKIYDLKNKNILEDYVDFEMSSRKLSYEKSLVLVKVLVDEKKFKKAHRYIDFIAENYGSHSELLTLKADIKYGLGEKENSLKLLYSLIKG